MKRLKKMLLIFGLGSLISAPVFAANTEIDEILRESGCVRMPFTANITQVEIKGEIDDVITDKFELASEKLAESLKTSLQGVTGLENKIPDIWGDWDDMVRALIDKAEAAAIKKITDNQEKFVTAINKKSDELAGAVKTKIDAAAPKAEITSIYTYCEGERDPGDPGWGSAQAPIIRGTKFVEHQIKVTFGPVGISIDITPLGVGGTVSVNIYGSALLKGRVDFKADSPIDPSPVNKPTATVKCTPSVDITVTASAGGGGAIAVETTTSAGLNKPFGQISGNITAGTQCQ